LNTRRRGAGFRRARRSRHHGLPAWWVIVLIRGRGILVAVRRATQPTCLVDADRYDDHWPVRRWTLAMAQRTLAAVHIRPVCATGMVDRCRRGQPHQCFRGDPSMVLNIACHLWLIARVSPGLERVERLLSDASGSGLARV
jgi:hypothetical protein